MKVAARGFPLVIAAPSGAGKTTLAHALVDGAEDVEFSVSATTRPRRPHEQDAVDYQFVDQHAFQGLIDRDELVEWAEVHGHRYGTPRSVVERTVAGGTVVVLDIDVQGARQIRASLPDAVLVFVLPPGASELHRRLAGRGSEAGAERARRLRNARAELPQATEFDYVVVNDDFERSVRALEAIVEAERMRASRLSGLADTLHRLDRDLKDILEES